MVKECEECRGRGKVEVGQYDDWHTANCHECLGAGQVEVEECDECGYHKVEGYTAEPPVKGSWLANWVAMLDEFIALGENGRNITKENL